MTHRRLKIGELASEAGVNVQTVRYYERRGLLAAPKRTRSGYREYAPKTVRLLRFIKGAQELGFTLREAQELLRLRERPARDRAEVRTVAEAKLTSIDEKVRQLESMRRALSTLVDSCACSRGALVCPILEALDKEGTTP